MLWEAGLAARLKSGIGGGLTIRATEVVCVRAPLVPVIVTGKVPVGTATPVLTLMVEELVAGFGLKLALAPVGKPVALKLTAPLKPPNGEMAKV